MGLRPSARNRVSSSADSGELSSSSGRRACAGASLDDGSVGGKGGAKSIARRTGEARITLIKIELF